MSIPLSIALPALIWLYKHNRKQPGRAPSFAWFVETLMPLGKEMPEVIYVAARHFFLTPDSDMHRKFVKTYYAGSRNGLITWPKRRMQVFTS
jgi:hypothetical protein